MAIRRMARATRIATWPFTNESIPSIMAVGVDDNICAVCGSLD